MKRAAFKMKQLEILAVNKIVLLSDWGDLCSIKYYYYIIAFNLLEANEG